MKNINLIVTLLLLTLFNVHCHQNYSSINNNKIATFDILQDQTNAQIELKQILIFNIGDDRNLENSSTTFTQNFNENDINYCNFDPDLLSEKKFERQKQNKNVNLNQAKIFNVNTFLNGGEFNESSEVIGKK
jgi:hypothetical protein